MFNRVSSFSEISLPLLVGWVVGAIGTLRLDGPWLIASYRPCLTSSGWCGGFIAWSYHMGWAGCDSNPDHLEEEKLDVCYIVPHSTHIESGRKQRIVFVLIFRIDQIAYIHQPRTGKNNTERKMKPKKIGKATGGSGHHRIVTERLRMLVISYVYQTALLAMPFSSKIIGFLVPELTGCVRWTILLGRLPWSSRLSRHR